MARWNLARRGKFARQAEELRPIAAGTMMRRPLIILKPQPAWAKASALASGWGLSDLAERPDFRAGTPSQLGPRQQR